MIYKKQRSTDTLLFKKRTINDMKKLNLETAQDGNERNAALCITDNNKINLENPKIGTPFNAGKISQCKHYDNKIGKFHTHPISVKEIGLSVGDLIADHTYNDSFICLGSPGSKEDKLTCFKNKEKSAKYQKEVKKEIPILNEMNKLETSLYKPKLKCEKWLEIQTEKYLKGIPPTKKDYKKQSDCWETFNKVDEIDKYLKNYTKKFLKQFNPEDRIE